MVAEAFENGPRAAAPRLKDWLFNPFTYIAGGQSLLIGLIAILAAGLLGSVSSTHFDGVLDTHTGLAAPRGIFLLEGLIDWLALAAVLLILGKLASRSSFRVIDLFGTQALARWPTIFIGLVTLLPGYRRFTVFLMQDLPRLMRPGSGMEFPAAEAAVFALVMLVVLVCAVWMVALMYRSFSVCCNLRGAKAAGVFILALIVAEAVSKLALLAIFNHWAIVK